MRRRRHGGMQHFCTGIKAKDMPAFLAMAKPLTVPPARRYALAAHNLARLPSELDKQGRADNLWRLMHDDTNPQLELPIC